LSPISRFLSHPLPVALPSFLPHTDDVVKLDIDTFTRRSVNSEAIAGMAINAAKQLPPSVQQEMAKAAAGVALNEFKSAFGFKKH
jgi:hypothetical protein